MVSFSTNLKLQDQNLGWFWFWSRGLESCSFIELMLYKNQHYAFLATQKNAIFVILDHLQLVRCRELIVPAGATHCDP
jgi:hypothetical protein